jgi:integrase
MSSVGYRVKSEKNKQVSIYIYLRPPNSQTISCRTGLTINPNNWSKTKMRAKAKDPVLKSLNNSLDSIGNFINNRLNSELESGIEFNNKWLKKKIDEYNNRDSKADISYLTSFLNSVLSNLKYRRANDGTQGLKKNTIKGYISFKNILLEYENVIEEKLRFNTLDEDLVDDFFGWLVKEKKYSKSMTGFIMKKLKNLIKEASLKDLVVSINPDIVGKNLSFKSDNIINIFSNDDYKKIKKIRDLNPSLENTRKWILIGLKVGQRVSDLLSITSKQIRFDKDEVAMIDIKQKKSGRAVTVPVKDKHVVSILKNNLPYKISQQNFNKYLKLVCEKAGIKEKVKGYKFNSISKRKQYVKVPKYEILTSHDLRRSFATEHYNNGVPVNFIMNITGHKRESTFYEYIGKDPKRDADAYNFLNAINE